MMSDPKMIILMIKSFFIISLESLRSLYRALWVGLFPTMDSNDISGWANLAFGQNCQQLKSYTLRSVPKFLQSSEFIVGIYSQWLTPAPTPPSPGDWGGESCGI